eukprot:scaffold7312_cov116-Isochrysis_galbana.AAC.2
MLHARRLQQITGPQQTALLQDGRPIATDAEAHDHVADLTLPRHIRRQAPLRSVVRHRQPRPAPRRRSSRRHTLIPAVKSRLSASHAIRSKQQFLFSQEPRFVLREKEIHAL